MMVIFILASETGAVAIDEERVIRKERLEPGKILLVDTVKGELIKDSEVKKKYSLENTISRMVR